MFRPITGFVLLACLFLGAASASAFMPGDQELSTLLQKKYGPLASWEVEMTFPDFPDVVAHIWYARGKWRQEWAAKDMATAVGLNGHASGACTAESFALSPLFVWMVADPLNTWKSWGIDNTIQSFGFCDNLPCYMLGARPGDDISPSAQLNNEDMSPILVRYKTEGGYMVVAFKDYRTFSGFRVPQTVVTQMGDNATLEAHVRWIAVNRAGGEELYARDALDGQPCAEPPSPFDLLRDHFRYPSQ